MSTLAQHHEFDLVVPGIRIGIDPGISGALALIDDERVHAVEDMPVIAKSSGKGQQVSAALLAAVLERWLADLMALPPVYLERVSAMPKQGVTSVFSFGRSFGNAEAVVQTLKLPLTYVSPQLWKRRANLLKAEKDASRARAIQLYPTAAEQLTRKRDGGRAEAILIGRFGE